jgi:cytochrome c-type protein NapB
MRALLFFLAAALALTGCRPADSPTKAAIVVEQSPALVRAERRLYDGAPPVIPHANMGMGCMNCHNMTGMSVPDIGFAPAMPHGETAGLSEFSNCTQCHVFQADVPPFKGSTFVGLRQDLRKGKKGFAFSPPVMPHPVFMRENCVACHSGPGSREEIRTDHPERPRCTQCHVPQITTELFTR